MYCLAFSFLALAALAAGSGYVPGREYVYRYQGHISAGFPEKKPQYSGIAYDTIVRVQPQGEYAIFSVEDSGYDTFNGVTSKYDKQPFSYEELPRRRDYNIPPFKVYFRNGQVTRFQINADEPAYSVNLRRGLISLFHLTFDPSESRREPSDYNQEEYSEYYYRTIEDGLLGECETQYVIEQLPYYKSYDNVLNITKTRNYERCNSVPNQYYSTFYGQAYGESQKERSHTLHGRAFYRYDIRGDRQDYVIEKVVTEGDLEYRPYPLNGQVAEIFVNRTLQLIEERDSVSQEYDLSRDLETYTSLQYDFVYKPKFSGPIDLKEPHYLYHIYGRQVPLEQIRQQIDDLLQVYDDETYQREPQEKNYPLKFLELVKSASTLGYNDIAQLYNEYAKLSGDRATQRELLARDLYLDVLVNAGTNPVFFLVKSLIQEGEFPDSYALYFLQQLPYRVKEVTRAFLNEFYALSRSEYIVQRPKLFGAAYISLASVIHDKCVARYHPEDDLPSDEYSCPEDIPFKYFREFANQYEETRDEYRKIVYITALGRLGVRKSLDFFKRYLEDYTRQSLLDRTDAIYSLRTLARTYPESVRQLIVPLYYNVSENYEVRLAAFDVLLVSYPQLHEIETIAWRLIEEKDDQVRSYVYSTLLSYENSTHPQDLNLSRYVAYALSILKPYQREFEKYTYGYGLGYSQQYRTSGYNEDYDYGGYTRFSYLASDTGYLPRSLYLEVNDFAEGKSYDTFSIGFRQHGLEKLVDKFFGPEGTYRRNSFNDIFKERTSGDGSYVNEERREINEKLHLQTKEYEDIDGEIVVNYLGNPYSVLYFNESTIQDFIRQGYFNNRGSFDKYRQASPYQYQRFHLPVDHVYLIPSEIGLPIILDFKQPTYFYQGNGDFQFNVITGSYREGYENKQEYGHDERQYRYQYGEQAHGQSEEQYGKTGRQYGQDESQYRQDESQYGQAGRRYGQSAEEKYRTQGEEKYGQQGRGEGRQYYGPQEERQSEYQYRRQGEEKGKGRYQGYRQQSGRQYGYEGKGVQYGQQGERQYRQGEQYYRHENQKYGQGYYGEQSERQDGKYDEQQYGQREEYQRDGRSYRPYYGQQYGPSYRPNYGQQYGQSYRPYYGQQHEQSYRPRYGQQYGQSHRYQYGQEYKKSYEPHYGQQYGQSYRPNYGEQYGQSYRPHYGQQYGQSHRYRYGQPYGQSYKPHYGQQYGQSYRSNYGEQDEQSYRPHYGQQYEQSYKPHYGQQYGQSYRYRYGQPYGQSYKPHYGQQYGQSYRPNYGEQDEQSYRPHYGQQYGQSYKPHYGQQYGQSYRPNYGEQDEKSYRPHYGQQYGQSYRPYYGQQYGRKYDEGEQRYKQYGEHEQQYGRKYDEGEQGYKQYGEHGQQYGRKYDQGEQRYKQYGEHGQQYGRHGEQYGQRYGQQYRQRHGQYYGQRYGQKYGQQYGHQFREGRREYGVSAGVQFNYEGHLIIDQQYVGYVGVLLPFDSLSFGAGIQKRSILSVPIKLNIGVDLKNGQFDFQFKPVAPHQIYHSEYEPFTYIDSHENLFPVFDEPQYQPVRREYLNQQSSDEIEFTPFGLKLQVDSDYESEFGDYGSLFKFFSRKDYREQYYYLTTNPTFEPYEYDVSLQYLEGETINEVNAQFSYSFYQGREEPPVPPTIYSQDEFERYQQQRTDKHLLTTVLHGEVVARGNREHRAQGDLVYIRDIYQIYHQLFSYYDETPQYSEEDQFKVCFNGYLKYPEIDYEKLSHLQTQDLDLTVETEVNAYFGRDCRNDQKFTVRGRIERTEEQLYLDRQRDEQGDAVVYNPYAYLYQQCVRDQQGGNLYPESCIEYLFGYVLKLNQYSFDIKHEGLSPQFLNLTYKFGRFIRHELYDYSDDNELYVENPENEFTIEANVSAINAVADIRVRRPQSESVYSRIYVPQYDAFSAYYNLPSFKTLGSLSQDYCFAMGNDVYTFDRYNYEIPFVDCYKILVKDFSPNEYFIVLEKRVNHPRYQRAFQAIVGSHKVEISPASEGSDFVVRVDGEQVLEEVSDNYYYYYEEGQDQPLFYVIQNEYYYVLYSPVYGFAAEYDGNYIAIQVSPYYKAKLSGLCGNYNGQRYDEYVDENGYQIEDDDDTYVYSYTIPSESCSRPRIEKSNYPSYPRVSETRCSELKTHVIQLTHGRVPQTCFSTEPVAQCRQGCTPKRQGPQVVYYHCLPSTDDFTRRLLSYSETRVLDELKRKSQDYEAEVVVQEGCYHL